MYEHIGTEDIAEYRVDRTVEPGSEVESSRAPAGRACRRGSIEVEGSIAIAHLLVHLCV